MTLIDSPEAYEAIWPYSGKPKLYPARYPCLCNVERIDCGIMGDGRRIAVLYPPVSFAHINPLEAFILGATAEVETLWES